MATANVATDESAEPGAPASTPLRRNMRGDVLAVASFTVIALWVTSSLWLHPTNASINVADQGLNEWFLAHGVRVWHGVEGPFYSRLMGAPAGINLVANTSVLGLSLPLAPLTILLGPRAVVALATFLGLALTPTGWYFLLSRRLKHRWAGWAGAMVAGLSPGMITNANGHLNLMCQFLVPVLVWRALKLAEPGQRLRNALWLAVIAVWQLFIGSEVLLLAAVGVGLFMLALAVMEPAWRSRWRHVLAGGGLAALIALVAAAYPIWFQFRGPGSYHGLPIGYSTVDANPFSYLFYARQSLFGTGREAAPWAPNLTEEDALLGFALVLATYAVVLIMRRDRTVRAVAVVAAVGFVCSLGPTFVNPWEPGKLPMPWALTAHLPVLSSMLPVRWAMVVTVASGVLVAIAVRALGAIPSPRRRLAALALTAVAVVPNLPKPLLTVQVPRPPQFFESGAIRPYLVAGRSVLFAPPTEISAPIGMYWSAESDSDYPIVQGYFLTPGPDGRATLTPPPRPLSRWLSSESRGTPSVRPTFDQAVADLRAWRTSVIVLSPVPTGESTETAAQAQVTKRLREDLSELLGRQPEQVDGVEFWDVRDLGTRS